MPKQIAASADHGRIRGKAEGPRRRGDLSAYQQVAAEGRLPASAT